MTSTGGDFGIWDLQVGVRLSLSSYLYQRDVKATEVDWLTESAPIITTYHNYLKFILFTIK